MSSTIEQRQELLTELYLSYKTRKEKPEARHGAAPTGIPLDDMALLDIARNAKNGAKFCALWAGNTAGYPSDSEADQALCCILAFYTGDDPNRIDQLFRGSSLYREEKWDRPARSGETYGQGTIARAIALLDETYGQRARWDRPHVHHQDEGQDDAGVTSYHYALNLTPERIDALSEDELKAACKEQYALINGMLDYVYAKQATPVTRITAIDLLANSASRTARGLSENITDPAPVCISNEYGTAARLGISRNSVSTAYNALEQSNLIERLYRESANGETEHLDIALKPTFLTNADHLQNKKQYTPMTPTTDMFKQAGDSKHCSECGSGNVDIICRDCGSVEQLGELPPHAPETHTVAGSEEETREDPCTKIGQSYSACELEECTKIGQTPLPVAAFHIGQRVDTPKGIYTIERVDRSAQRVSVRISPNVALNYPFEWVKSIEEDIDEFS